MKAWLSVSTPVNPKGVLSGWGQDSIHTKLCPPCLYGPAQSCWNRKGSSPKCSHKVGSMELSNISWYAEAFRVPFLGSKGPSPAAEKQPHTIIPPSPNFTLGTMQSDKNRSPGNHWTQTRPSDCQMEKCDSLLQTTCLHCSSVLYTTASDTGIALADVWLGCSCSAIETHSMKLSTHWSWANLRATWSLEVCSD